MDVDEQVGQVLDLVVLAPLAYVRVPGEPALQLEHGQPVPTNADVEHVTKLVDQGVLGSPEDLPVDEDAVGEPGEQEPVHPPAPESDRIEDILAWVAGDTGRAGSALAVEQAKDRPRPQLVTKLEEIATSPADDNGGS